MKRCTGPDGPLVVEGLNHVYEVSYASFNIYMDKLDRGLDFLPEALHADKSGMLRVCNGYWLRGD